MIKEIILKMKNLGIFLFFILFSFYFNQTYTDFNSDSSDPSPNPTYIPDDSLDSIYPDPEPTNPTNGTEPIPKIILLGFEHFKINEKKKINFNVVFRVLRRIAENIFPKKLILTIRIFNGLLRNLEEKDIKTIECPRISKEGENIIKFQCSNETYLDNIKIVSVDKKYSLIDKDGNIINNLTLHSFLTGYANRTMGNIYNQNEALPEFIILENSSKINDEEKFFVMGNISENGNIEDNTEVTLYIDENENGTIKEIPCNLKDEQKYYELQCSPKPPISFHLDNVDGKITKNKYLIVSMNDDVNDYISFPEPTNDIVPKKKDKGLSTGAIVGIVIACVILAIISIVTALLLCRRPAKPPMQTNITKVDIYSNVSKSSQQDISK